jgi:CrcB protein
MRILLIAIFGALGTLARYGLQSAVQQRVAGAFPSGTLVVNLIGCFLIGGIGEYALLHVNFPPEWRLALTVGFLGGFTTFSAFSNETVRLLQQGYWRSSSLYVLASVIGGILCVATGIKLADRIS